MSSTNLLYRRQFIAGPDPRRMPDGWKVIEFGAGWYIGAHPDLVVTAVLREAKGFLCLGHIIDTNSPKDGNETVVSRIAELTTSFDDLEARLSHCGGRWLFFANLFGEQRLYPDAGGTRSAFYTTRHDPQGELWIVSQPALMSDALGIRPSEKMVQEFMQAPHGNSWPGEATPYPGVRQLLPNHYLDMRTHKIHRFWPIKRLVALDPDVAAVRIDAILHNLLQGIVARGRTAVPLTGGHDSRAVYAAARGLREELTFFLIKDFTTPYHDGMLAKRVAREFSTSLRLIETRPCPPDFRSDLRKNVADMIWEPGEIKMYTFGQHFHDWFIVTGGIAEVGRCFYYKDGVAPSFVTPQVLSQVSEYPNNSIAFHSYARWLTDVPFTTNIHPLDLFYIEHRVGNWLSVTSNAFDMVCEVIPAYNCRQYFETALSVDVEYRKNPYELFRRICEIGAPGSSKIPFNQSALDVVADWLKTWIPWRIQKRFRAWQMRRSGFEYGHSICYLCIRSMELECLPPANFL